MPNSPTILEVLAASNRDQYPPELQGQAKNLYEMQLGYTGHVERSVAGIVRDMAVLTITPEEAKDAIGSLLDLKGDVDKRAADAFAKIAADFEAPKKDEPKPNADVKPIPTLPDPSPLPQGSGTAPTNPAQAGGSPVPIPSPSAETQDEIAKRIKDKIAAEAGKGGETGQGPNSKPPVDSPTPSNTAESTTGLAAPATEPKGFDASKNVV